MNNLLSKINEAIYIPNRLILEALQKEKESQEYGACKFEINGLKIISRNAKITPKKAGQFVTSWKRSTDGITQPFEESDPFDLLVINVQLDQQLGQFVFPKSILKEKGILSTSKKDGKRGFRVYPSWDQPLSKQAIKTQAWQIQFFVNFPSLGKSIQKLYSPIHS